MKRSERATLARETIDICEAGHYQAANGKRVEIHQELNYSKANTFLYSPESLLQTNNEVSFAGKVEVSNESTLEAIYRFSLDADCQHLACLNFASAKNAGGGFLHGSQAQEESIARSSTLYPTLLKQPEYYSRNREYDSCLYLDLVIFSHSVLFIRNDDGDLLDPPIKASVITAPAPNAGAIRDSQPDEAARIEEALLRRGKLVLDIAASRNVTHLVLGAWGCGVFRNDPRMVAKCFAQLLNKQEYAARFARIVFAIFDPGADKKTYQAFREVLGSDVTV